MPTPGIRPAAPRETGRCLATPSYPYTVELSDSFSQFAESGYHKYDVRSGGADTPRPITLRTKPSTGQWFLWEQILMVQIRVPVSQDPWA